MEKVFIPLFRINTGNWVFRYANSYESSKLKKNLVSAFAAKFINKKM